VVRCGDELVCLNCFVLIQEERGILNARTFVTVVSLSDELVDLVA
jgi:hypothetical protein